MNAAESCLHLRCQKEADHTCCNSRYLNAFLPGLGVELSGQLVITSVTPGGKAHHAGIRVGDRVVNLNGIDTAHLSLIDAAYLMRREQSDVTLLRVEHEGEEERACLPPEDAQLPVYDDPPHRGHSCCTLQGKCTRAF